MESRDKHEVEKLRRRPQNGTVHVRREELGLEFFEHVRFGLDYGHGNEKSGDGNGKAHLVEKHFFDDASQRGSANSATHESGRRHAFPIHRNVPLALFVRLGKGFSRLRDELLADVTKAVKESDINYVLGCG